MTPLQNTILFWAQLLFYGAGLSAMLYLQVNTWMRDRAMARKIKEADEGMERTRARLEESLRDAILTCPRCGARLIPEKQGPRPVADA